MYGKLFLSMYDGTLRADWKAMVTFQQLIVLGYPNGIVDMTPHAIHGRTGIPLEIIQEGIEALQQPDEYSRSDAEEGRRIALLDPHRPWGWRIVNYKYYKELASQEAKREKDRRRIAKKRRKNKDDYDCSVVSHDVAVSSNESQTVENVAQLELEKELNTKLEPTVGKVEDIKTTNTRKIRANGLLFFDRFWKAYPKKKSKGQAEKAWQSLKPSEQLVATMIAKIKRATTSEAWRKEGGKFIPYPATWLRAKGWEDEDPKGDDDDLGRVL